MFNANKLIAYTKNINNPFDLKNYLHFKTITIGDWIRGFYSLVMTTLGLTNYYRYDHLLAKSDGFYEFEKIKMAMNLADKSWIDRISSYTSMFNILTMN